METGSSLPSRPIGHLYTSRRFPDPIHAASRADSSVKFQTPLHYDAERILPLKFFYQEQNFGQEIYDVDDGRRPRMGLAASVSALRNVTTRKTPEKGNKAALADIANCFYKNVDIPQLACKMIPESDSKKKVKYEKCYHYHRRKYFRWRIKTVMF
ncbi:MAG: hypothetical protein LBB26_03795 [Puniceicoccales bacterium]|jgi:hypothetical protein|nr:hypothetical protein [Puniceicoccales bacterium]